MKRFASILAVILFVTASAFAQGSTAPTTVAMLNFQRAVSQNDDGLKAATMYNEEGKKLQESLDSSKAKIVEMQDKLTKSTMSDSERAALTREIDRAKKVFEADQQAAQNAIEDKSDELFRPIADRVKRVVEEYAKQLNYAVVLNQTEEMIYANEVVDITTEIIRRVNADIVKNPAKK